MSSRSRFFKNSMIYTLTTLILNGASFFLLPLYTRLLSPSDLGNIYLIQTTGTILSMIASFQISGALSRYYFDMKQNKNKVKRMYTTICVFTAIITTVIYSLIFIFQNHIFKFIEVEFFPYVFFGLLSSYFSIFYSLILSLLYVEEKAKQISILSLYCGIGSIVLNIIFVINFKDKLAGYLLSNLILTFVQFIIFIKFSMQYFTKDFKIKDVGRYVKYSVQKLPGELSVWIVTFADRYMIDEMKGSYQNGIYSLGYKLGSIADFVFLSVNKAYVPYVFDKYSDLTEENEKAVTTVALNVFSLYMVITFGLMVFSKEIVYLMDPSYSNSVYIMCIILLSYLLNGIKCVFHNPMDFKVEYVRIKSIIWLISAIINVILNLMWIPVWGMYGAALATFTSYLVTLIPILWFSKKAIKIRYDYRKFGKVCIVSIIYLLLLLFKISLVTFSLKIFLSYIYISLVLKINNYNLFDLIRALKKRFFKNNVNYIKS